MKKATYDIDKIESMLNSGLSLRNIDESFGKYPGSTAQWLKRNGYVVKCAWSIRKIT